MNVIKYPVGAFYFKVSVDEHLQYKQSFLSMLDKHPEPTDMEKQFFSKIDWIYKNDEREWATLIGGLINKYNTLIGETVGYCCPEIHNIWFQQYKKSNIHPWHVHSGQFVGVYYVELPDDCPKTELVCPWDNKVISVDVKEGDILIFPSMIIHRAPEVINDSRKTIISWNLVYNSFIPSLTEKLNVTQIKIKDPIYD